MDDRAIPPALADVIGPLREANEYTRVQIIRQRGLYNLLTGAPMFFLTAPMWISLATYPHGPPPWPTPWFGLSLTFLAYALFFVSCFPKLFLPLVRRHRPDWQEPFLKADLLKKGLEKQFWFQFPFFLLYPILISVPTFVLVSALLRGESPAAALVPSTIATAKLVSQVLLVALFAIASLLLAWQARRANDRGLATMFLAWLPTGILAALVDPTTQLPSPFPIFLFMAALATPPILVGLARLLAPRRWLL